MNLNVSSQPMLRQPMQPPMLGLGPNPPYMQNQAQQGQQPGMAMQSSGGPPMGMLGGGGPPNGNGQRYPMNMQPNGGIMPQQPQQRHSNMMMARGPSNGQPMNPAPGNMNGPPMGGLNPAPMQGMPFSGMMPQGGNSMRRVPSHPQLNSGPMTPNLPNNMNMPMSMNSSTSMPAQIRANLAHANQLRQMPNNTGMPGADMMNRQPGPPHGMGRPNNMSQQQVMGSLQQPPSHGQPGMSPQNNFQNSQTQRSMNSSPRPSQPHGGNMGPQMPPHAMGGRPGMEHGDFMFPGGFPGPSGPNRMPNGQFPFAQPSTPPTMPSDMSSQNLSSPPGGSNRLSGGFHLTPTPAQQFQQMQGSENFSSNFGMPDNIPPRPPSHASQHGSQSQMPPQQPSHHNSPDPMYPPQRPQSQPPQRPPSQPVVSQTPRPQVPNPNRAPPHAGPSQPPQPPPIAPRPPQPPSSNQPGPSQSHHSSPSSSSTTQSSSDQHPTVPGNIPRGPNFVTLPLGTGQGITRLLQFSGNLATEHKTKFQLSWWNDLIQEYFTPKAIMKFRLWRDNGQNEAKLFEIGVPILPRFFLVTTQSGVKSMTLTMDGARERMYSHGHSVVECVTAVWTYKYTNGYTVMLRGPLTVHVVITSAHPPGSTPPPGGGGYLLRFEEFQFDATLHDKCISLDAIVGQRESELPSTPRLLKPPTPGGLQGDDPGKYEEPRTLISQASIPGEPVNAFGIPQATMRCLELAESVTAMSELIAFSAEGGLGPKDALSKLAVHLRESGVQLPPQPVHMGLPMQNQFGPWPPPMIPINGLAPSPAMTLYSSAPASITNPSSTQTNSTMSSPQNAPPSAQNSPQKQHKSIPQPLASGSSSVPAPSSAPGSTGNTPSLTNATLKRKQGADGNASSPTTTAPEQPAAKRSTRKRTRTQGGG